MSASVLDSTVHAWGSGLHVYMGNPAYVLGCCEFKVPLMFCLCVRLIIYAYNTCM